MVVVVVESDVSDSSVAAVVVVDDAPAIVVVASGDDEVSSSSLEHAPATRARINAPAHTVLRTFTGVPPRSGLRPHSLRWTPASQASLPITTCSLPGEVGVVNYLSVHTREASRKNPRPATGPRSGHRASPPAEGGACGTAPVRQPPGDPQRDPPRIRYVDARVLSPVLVGLGGRHRLEPGGAGAGLCPPRAGLGSGLLPDRRAGVVGRRDPRHPVRAQPHPSGGGHARHRQVGHRVPNRGGRCPGLDPATDPRSRARDRGVQPRRPAPRRAG